jgi:hypothetical protein
MFWVATPFHPVGEKYANYRQLLFTETSGRQQLCHKKDNCAGYAGHRSTYSECQPAKIRSAGWASTRVLHSHGVSYIHLHSSAGM